MKRQHMKTVKKHVTKHITQQIFYGLNMNIIINKKKIKEIYNHFMFKVNISTQLSGYSMKTI